MAFFVGGQLFLVAALVPIERRAPERERMRAVARLFAYGTLVLWARCSSPAWRWRSHFDQWGNAALHVKLALVAATAGLILWHMRRPGLSVLEGVIFVASLARSSGSGSCCRTEERHE
jgi:hypothetical protein